MKLLPLALLAVTLGLQAAHFETELSVTSEEVGYVVRVDIKEVSDEEGVEPQLVCAPQVLYVGEPAESRVESKDGQDLVLVQVSSSEEEGNGALCVKTLLKKDGKEVYNGSSIVALN